MSFNVTYRFFKHCTPTMQNMVVFSLRRDGFSATIEYDRENKVYLLKTNATFGQVALSCGHGNLIHD